MYAASAACFVWAVDAVDRRCRSSFHVSNDFMNISLVSPSYFAFQASIVAVASHREDGGCPLPSSKCPVSGMDSCETMWYIRAAASRTASQGDVAAGFVVADQKTAW